MKEFPPEKWERLVSLFDRMLDAGDPRGPLETESDPEIASAAADLWRRHTQATEARFLEETITMVREFHAPLEPCFAEGQVLASRFRILEMLGAGGMGEVYLAEDGRLREVVALKTIRRHLAGDEGMRSRFLKEIQNARRVTHPNVCRIFDLFDEGGTPFLAMEYLKGERLAANIRRPPRLAKNIALQLAEGLHAAHRSGILHCDFKPANVILTGDPAQPRAVITDFGLARAFSAGDPQSMRSLYAGTPDYMAPELRGGAAPTIRSDIYAFGKVLEQMTGPSRLASACRAERPDARPESLEPVIRELRGGSARRLVVIAGAAAVLGGGGVWYASTRPRLVLVGRQRLVVNGFRPREWARAGFLRDLLITALRQSPLVTVVGDNRLLAVLGAMKLPATLPVERAHLLAAAARDRIAMAIEGTVEEAGEGIRLLMQVFLPQQPSPAIEVREQAPDAAQMVRMVDRLATQLRREFGESDTSLRAAHTPLEQVTSRSPEAVELHFRGIQTYEKGSAEGAQAFFDQAVNIDPQFALAHLWRGLSFAARAKAASAIPSYERAFALRNRVTERERLWIEGRYYNIVGDYQASLQACRRLTTLYPEEATFQRHTAFAYARTGRPADALPHNFRAVELDPFSDNNRSELLANHAEANRNEEALALFRRFREEGHTSTVLDFGAGLAHMGEGRYEGARLAFERMAVTPQRDRWSRLLRCGPLIMEGRFAEAAAALASDLAYDVATGEENRRQIRRSWLGQLDWLVDSPGRARVQTVELVKLEASPAWLFALREGGLMALAIEERDLAADALDRLREIERRWPSTHSRGARAHLEGALLAASGDSRAGDLFLEARGLWPDPPVLFSLAVWQAGTGDLSGALATHAVLETQRGRILANHFPGLLVLVWIERARCYKDSSQFDDSLRYYQRALDHWQRNAGHSRLMAAVRQEAGVVRSRITKGD